MRPLRTEVTLPGLSDNLLEVRGVLDVTRKQLDIGLTLFNGQVFRWVKRNSSHRGRLEAVGVIGSYVIELSQSYPTHSLEEEEETGQGEEKDEQKSESEHKSTEPSKSDLNGTNRESTVKDQEEVTLEQSQNGDDKSVKKIGNKRALDRDNTKEEKEKIEPESKRQKTVTLRDNLDERVHWRLMNPLTCTSKKSISPKLIEMLKEQVQQRLHSYFQLDVDLEQLYQEWCDKDPIFKRLSGNLTGIRIMQQDLTENLFAFICSSNNNMDRIGFLVKSLAMLFGRLLYIDSELGKFFAFPRIQDLPLSASKYALQGNCLVKLL
jgi:hypothetical protein